MANLIQGKEGQYVWLQRSVDAENTGWPLAILIKHCPEVLLNKYVVVSALDSGPLNLNDQQISAGWQQQGKLALSPRIANAADVPFEWFDEWYIFDDAAVTPETIEVFVNYGTFSLGDPNPTIETMYIGPDAGVKASMAEAAEQLRQKFWAQLDRVNPESYVANGNCFLFVTREANLLDQMAAALESG